MNEELMTQDEDVTAPAVETAEQVALEESDGDTEHREEENGELAEDEVYSDEEYSLDRDMDELAREHKALIATRKNTNPERYSELRAMGLSPKEAFLATSERKALRDTREHLSAGMPKAAKSPSTSMSRRELMLARALFDGMNDEQIIKLYNKIKA